MGVQKARLVAGLLAALAASAVVASCGSLIDESFEGYRSRSEAGLAEAGAGEPSDAHANERLDASVEATVLDQGDVWISVHRDAFVPEDGEVRVGEAPPVPPDAGTLAVPGAGRADGSVDSALPAASPVLDGAIALPTIRLGKDGGCEGIPFRSFEFEHDVESWKVEQGSTVDAAVAHVLGEGSPGAGALRFSIGFSGANQGTKVFVALPDYPALRCVSARMQVAPNTLDDDLAAHPGAWTIAAISRNAWCYAQVSYDNQRDLRQAGVWYEIAFDTKDFRPRECDFSQVDSVLIGVANAYETSTAKPAEVFVDHVALY